MNTPDRTPDPVASIFTAYTDDTTAEVKDGSTVSLRRKAKRRRVGRTATAGAAALALIAPAAWLLANTAGADDREQPQTAHERPIDDDSVPPDEDQYWDAYGPGPDLVGATIVLPSFAPGNADVDAVCASDGAELSDGTVQEPVDDGAVFLVQTGEALMSDGSEEYYQVGLFGCRYGEQTLYQAVTLDEVEDDTWAAGTQLVHSELDGESPQHLGFAVGDGVVVGFAERYDPAADDLRYWAERITLNAGGEPVREVIGDLGPEAYSELSVGVTAAATEETGVWTVTVEIHNTGPRTVTDYVLTAATDPQVEVLSGVPVNLRTDPLGTWDAVAEIDEIPVDHVFIMEWTVAVDTSGEHRYGDLQFLADVASATPYDELPSTVQALGWIGAAGTCIFTE
ncbi:hypothetical protein [Glycomyces harbinensis]|uniref:Uncharacterized protein n=1 Tax=Glycomyces harbinensis TaxID=58114 RepID=A0A1G7CTT4_9ACTN|nr:hypothetical protein [Glycomyces harbinensis]SDE42834.1 hypothetical protein SAMN05216270_12133 [Glycomyces harbinensis]